MGKISDLKTEMLCNGKLLWDIWFHTTVDLDDRKKICRLWRQRVQLGSRDALSRGKSSGEVGRLLDLAGSCRTWLIETVIYVVLGCPTRAD